MEPVSPSPEPLARPSCVPGEVGAPGEGSGTQPHRALSSDWGPAPYSPVGPRKPACSPALCLQNQPVASSSARLGGDPMWLVWDQNHRGERSPVDLSRPCW